MTELIENQSLEQDFYFETLIEVRAETFSPDRRISEPVGYLTMSIESMNTIQDRNQVRARVQKWCKSIGGNFVTFSVIRIGNSGYFESMRLKYPGKFVVGRELWEYRSQEMAKV